MARCTHLESVGCWLLRAGNGERVENLWGCPMGTRMCNDLLDLSYRNISSGYSAGAKNADVRKSVALDGFS